MIVRKIPSVLPKFEDMLDQVKTLKNFEILNPALADLFHMFWNCYKAISLAEHDINDVDCELKLDYKVWLNEWKYMKINISGAHSYQRERGERYVHGIHRNWVIWQ